MFGLSMAEKVGTAGLGQSKIIKIPKLDGNTDEINRENTDENLNFKNPWSRLIYL